MRPTARHTCCMHCGAAWPDPEGAWPRGCGACGHESYRNPIPVSVVLASTADGEALTVRRNIPPAIGELGLPGGYQNLGETMRAAAARELWEETGIDCRAEAEEILELFDVKEGRYANLTFFILRRPVRKDEVCNVPNEETQEVVWVREPIPLCFPTHTEALAEWLGRHVGTR